MTTTEENFVNHTNNNETFLLLNLINITINETSQSDSDVTPILKQVHDILIVLLLICVMFAMGCSVTIEQVSFNFIFYKLYANLHYLSQLFLKIPSNRVIL